MVSRAQEFSLRWNNHHNTLVTVLDKLLQRETFVDVILAAEGQFIKVHRIVLCACSDYFEDLLNQQTDKQSIIFLKDVTFVTLNAIVDYMYRGEVNISEDQLLSFLQTTEALKIKGLADKRGPSTQATNSMASTVVSAAEQAQATSPPPTPSPLVASASTVEEVPQELLKEIPPSQLTATASTIEEVEEMPELQEIQHAPLAIITSVATVEEILEISVIKEVERTPTPVPTSINSETMHMETDYHLTVAAIKVEDPDIDISAEQLEGGEDLELEDDSLWQTQVAEAEDDEEEDWSNSEDVSVASAPDDASGAGPSTSKQNVTQGAKPKGSSSAMSGSGIGRRFTCHRCGFSTIYKGSLVEHVMKCRKIFLLCPHCPFKTVSKCFFNSHMRSHLKGGVVHKCPFCPYITNHSTDCRKHVARKHPANK